MRDFAGTPASRHSQRCHWLLGRLAGRPSASPYRANHFPRGPLARLAAAGTLAQVHRRPATWSRVTHDNSPAPPLGIDEVAPWVLWSRSGASAWRRRSTASCSSAPEFSAATRS